MKLATNICYVGMNSWKCLQRDRS